MRVVIEAYLLAAAPLSQIVERTGLLAAGIAAYHACFFDIGDRLARPDYILRRVILACASPSAAAPPALTSLKLAAYLGGPRVLAELLATPRPQSEKLADLLSALEETNDSLVVLTKYLAIFEGSAVSGEVAREGLLQRVRRQAAMQRDEPLTEYEQMMQEVLARVKIYPRKNPKEMPPEVRPYHTGCGELRAHELMEWGLTGTPPGPEVLAELHQKFPDPPAREQSGAAGEPSNA